MAPDETGKKNNLPWQKKAIFLVILSCASLVIMEGAARLILYFKEGRNPYYLKFGFVADTEYHSYGGPGYTKYPPNTLLHQKVGERTISIKINSSGFRSTRDFNSARDETVFRIATLGSSSTFGYYVEDGQTYPSQLEQMLQASYPRRRIEVLNLGIPHARMDDIVALARHELSALKPNIVTLYEGVNDANWPKQRQEAGKIYRLKDWLYFHSVFSRIVNSSVKHVYYSFVGMTKTDPVTLPHLEVPLHLTDSQIERLRETIRRNFRVNLEKLYEISVELGATLILVTQHYKLNRQPGESFEDKPRTYEEQLAMLRDMYHKSGGLSAPHASFLVHSDLQNEVKRFAKERNLGLVDGIAVLEQDPSLMLSSVHLSPLGNQRVARAIHDYLESKKVIPENAAANYKPNQEFAYR